MSSANVLDAASSRQNRHTPFNNAYRSRPISNTRNTAPRASRDAKRSEEIRDGKVLGLKRPRDQFGPRQDAKTLTSLGTKAGYIKRKAADQASGSWNWYYFIMRPATFLYLYETADDKAPSSIIDMEFLDKIEYKSQVSDAYGKKKFYGSSKYSFRITPSKERYDANEQCESSLDDVELYLDPTLAKEGSEWIEALQSRNQSPLESLKDLEEKLEQVHAQNLELVEQLKLLSDEKNTALDQRNEAQQDADFLQDKLTQVSRKLKEALERFQNFASPSCSTEGIIRKSRLKSQRNSENNSDSALICIQEMVSLCDKMNQEIQQQADMLSSLKEQEDRLKQELSQHKKCFSDLGAAEKKVNELQRKLHRTEEASRSSEAKDAQIEKLQRELKEYSSTNEMLAKYKQGLREHQSLLVNMKKNADYQLKMRELAEQRAEEALQWRKFHDEMKNLLQESGSGNNSNSIVAAGARKSNESVQKRASKYFQSTSLLNRKASMQPLKIKSTANLTKPSLNKSGNKSRYQRAQPSSAYYEDEQEDRESCISSASSAKPTESPLPKGWTKVESRHYPGDFYYHNTDTGETSWELPKASVVKTQSSRSRASAGSNRSQDSNVRSGDQMDDEKSASSEVTEDVRSKKSYVNLDHSSFMRMGTRRKTNTMGPPSESKRDDTDVIDSCSGEEEEEAEEQPLQVQAQQNIKNRVLLAKERMQKYKWNKSLITRKSLFSAKEKGKAPRQAGSKSESNGPWPERRANVNNDSIY